MLRLQLDDIVKIKKKNRKWSPVKGSGQEVSSGAEPAHAICDRAYACDSLVLLLGWTLLFRKVVWDVRVLLYQHSRVLLEGHHPLHKAIKCYQDTL